MADYAEKHVEDLREELRGRSLSTTGHKDELIARLEEDDAARDEAPPPEEGGGGAPDQPLPEAPTDPYLRVYSPFELPANTAAAQAFIDAHPEAVDTTLTLPDEQLALAQANIQDHVDQMASMGITVEDPRLEGYTPPPPAGEPEPVAELEEAKA